MNHGLIWWLYRVAAAGTRGIPEHVWADWPGTHAEALLRQKLKEEAQAKFRSTRFFSPREEMNDFYLGL